MIRESQCKAKYSANNSLFRIIIVAILMVVVSVTVDVFTKNTDANQMLTANITYQEQRPVARVSDFAVSSKYIHIYYDRLGLVETYDLAGKYMYSITIQCPPNGAGRIGLDGDILYIEDRVSNVYCFEDNKQIGFHRQGTSNFSENIFSEAKIGYTFTSGRLVCEADNAVILDLSDSSVHAVNRNIAASSFMAFAVVLAFMVINKMKARNNRTDSNPCL